MFWAVSCGGGEAAALAQNDGALDAGEVEGGADAHFGQYTPINEVQVKCCAEGEGTDCCVGIDASACLPFGGSHGCSKAGEKIQHNKSGGIPCAHCCTGLIERGDQVTLSGAPGDCRNEPPIGTDICVPC